MSTHRAHQALQDFFSDFYAVHQSDKNSHRPLYSPVLFLINALAVLPATPASSVSARPPGLSFSLSLPLSPCLCLTAVRVRGDATRAAGHRAVSGQPAVAAQARSQRVANTAFAPGRATGAGGGGEPQQRQAVHGHRPP